MCKFIELTLDMEEKLFKLLDQSVKLKLAEMLN